VSFWSTRYLSHSFNAVKNAYEVTADELDSLKLHVLDPEYTVNKNEIMGQRVFFAILFIVILGLLLAHLL
jgi:hypothetical protein